MDESAESLIRAGMMKPIIMVAIWNAGERRIDEYTPTQDARSGRGGKAYLYARMLVEELKPLIDSTYRTLRQRRHTGLCGSSLGALVSLYTGLRYPDVFGKLAAMSPSVWWDRRSILKMVQAYEPSTRPGMWLDVGTREGLRPQNAIRDVRLLRDALLAKGWALDRDLGYFEAIGADHSEAAWARRVPMMLRFLFPRRAGEESGGEEG